MVVPQIRTMSHMGSVFGLSVFLNSGMLQVLDSSCLQPCACAYSVNRTCVKRKIGCH